MNLFLSLAGAEEAEALKSALEEELSKSKELEECVEELKEQLEEEQNTTDTLKGQLEDTKVLWQEQRELTEEEQSNVAELRETVRGKELELEEMVEREQRLQEEFTLASN